MQMDEIESFFKEVYQEHDQESDKEKTVSTGGRTGGFIIAASSATDGLSTL